MAGGGTWTSWLVGTVEVGRVEDAQGMCVSGTRGQLRAEPWEGPRFRDGWKEELMKSLEKEHLEVNWNWNKERREQTMALNRALGPEG